MTNVSTAPGLASALVETLLRLGGNRAADAGRAGAPLGSAGARNNMAVAALAPARDIVTVTGAVVPCTACLLDPSSAQPVAGTPMRGQLRLLPETFGQPDQPALLSGRTGTASTVTTATAGTAPDPSSGSNSALAPGAFMGARAEVISTLHGQPVLRSGPMLLLVELPGLDLPAGTPLDVAWHAAPEPAPAAGPMLDRLVRLLAAVEQPSAQHISQKRPKSHDPGRSQLDASHAARPGLLALPDDVAAESSGQSVQPASADASAAEAQRATDSPQTLPTVPDGLARLAALLGGSVIAVDPEAGRGQAESEQSASGRCSLAVDFSALGPIRIDIAWTKAGIELAVRGRAPFTDPERIDLVRAVAHTCSAAGVSGQALLLPCTRVAASG